ncbi:MAG: AAA family ATPase [Candidatus Bathyarchaeota archaeon]|nr:AAA family ATPase [Candidatus Bathyarchaeota archaeon]
MIYGSKNRSELLLATGLDLEKIATVLSSRDIEDKLLEFGEKYLERYQTYREYTELVQAGEVKDALIPIIAAVPGVGKTTVAREIATAFGIGNVMGGDAMRAAFRALISEKEHPEFFCSVYEAYKVVGDKTQTKENISKGFYTQAFLMNKLMQKIVADRGIRDGESMVIEYLHFLPTQYEEEVLRYPGVIPIVLRLDSKEEHTKRLEDRETSSHLKGKGQRLIEALYKYRIMQEIQCTNAKQADIPIIPTDNPNTALDNIFTTIHIHIKKTIQQKNTPHNINQTIQKIMNNNLNQKTTQ